MTQQNQKPKNKAMMQMIIGACMIFTAIMCICMGAWQNKKAIYLSSHCEKVTATITNPGVVEKHSHTRTTSSGSKKFKKRKTYTEYTYTQSYDVSYKHNGKDYTTHMEEQAVPLNGYVDGDIIEIYIEKDNPSKVSSTDAPTGAITQIIVGSAIAIVGFFIIIMGKRKTS